MWNYSEKGLGCGGKVTARENIKYHGILRTGIIIGMGLMVIRTWE